MLASATKSLLMIQSRELLMSGSGRCETFLSTIYSCVAFCHFDFHEPCLRVRMDVSVLVPCMRGMGRTRVEVAGNIRALLCTGKEDQEVEGMWNSKCLYLEASVIEFRWLEYI